VKETKALDERKERDEGRKRGLIVSRSASTHLLLCREVVTFDPEIVLWRSEEKLVWNEARGRKVCR
jgi:hypothetical protein